jgi:hypothetical protein
VLISRMTKKVKTVPGKWKSADTASEKIRVAAAIACARRLRLSRIDPDSRPRVYGAKSGHSSGGYRSGNCRPSEGL